MSGVSPKRDWSEKADQYLDMARRALGPEKPLPGMACYHAQQCAEKVGQGLRTRISQRTTSPIMDIQSP